MNIKFNYLYRDASNYKNYNSIIFSNSENLSITDIEKMITSNLIDQQFFVASKINIPEIFLSSEYGFNEDDHSWHEFESLEETDEAVTDELNRNISDFVNELK